MRIPIPLAVCGLLALAVPAQEKKGFTEASWKKATLEADDAWDVQDYEAAAAAYRKVAEMKPDDGRAWHRLGYSLHALGRLGEALQAHLKAAEFPDLAPVATYNVACVHALRGDKDKAFEWLAKAQERGFNRPDQLVVDQDMDSLRDDPRFAQIKEKMKAGAEAGGGALRVFAISTPRQGQRLLFWAGSGSPGQVSIDYGAPAWKESYARQIDRMTGRRWRLGKDFWTVLDTNVDLTVAGAEVPAGAYYLTAEIKEDGRYVLAFNDPAEIRKKRLDAFLAHQTEGGIEIELQHAEVDEVAETLEIAIVEDERHKTKAELVIRFGPHHFTAPITVALEK